MDTDQSQTQGNSEPASNEQTKDEEMKDEGKDVDKKVRIFQ